MISFIKIWYWINVKFRGKNSVNNYLYWMKGFVVFFRIYIKYFNKLIYRYI